MRAIELRYNKPSLIGADLHAEPAFSAISFYIPDIELIVERKEVPVRFSGQPLILYNTIHGPNTKEEYGKLADISGVRQREIEVERLFAEYALALHKFRNASEEILRFHKTPERSEFTRNWLRIMDEASIDVSKWLDKYLTTCI